MTDNIRTPTYDLEEEPQGILLAVRPVHKRWFGTAVGLTLGGLIFLATGYATLWGDAPSELSLLANYFPGYSVSWSGAVIGGVWGMFVFFVAGWFCAFVRNFTIGATIWIVRTRAELEATRNFLDHI